MDKISCGKEYVDLKPSSSSAVTTSYAGLRQLCECVSSFNTDIAVMRKHIQEDMLDVDDIITINKKTSKQDDVVKNIVQSVSKAQQLLLKSRSEIDLTCSLLEQLKGSENLCTRVNLCSCGDGEVNFEGSKQDDEGFCSGEHQLKGDGNAVDENSKNWPPFVYMNPRRNKFKQHVCCVLQTKPGSFDQTDVYVHGSDTDEDLAKCLESNDEEILSCLVTLESRGGNMLRTDTPLYIFLPAVDHSQHLFPAVKYMANGNIWHHGERIQDITIPTAPAISFLGTELQLQKIEKIQCVAIAKPHTEMFQISGNGATVTLHDDQNIQLTFPPDTFCDDTDVTTKSRILSRTDMEKASRRYIELENVRQTSSLVTINCEVPARRDIEFSIYNFGTKDELGMTPVQETLERCNKWLLNNLKMTKIEPRLENLFPLSIKESISKEKFEVDKIHKLISELQQSSEETLSNFIEILQNVGQKQAAERLRNTKDQLDICKNEGATDDLASSSDFDPGFITECDTVRIVSKSGDQQWSVKPLISNECSSNACTISLEANSSSYSVLGVLVPNKMPDTDVCKAASIVEEITLLKDVSLVARQHCDNPDDIIIHCLRSEKLDSRLKELSKMGFTIGPTKLPEFGMIDGEQIMIRFDSNIFLEGYENKPLVMTFYSGLDMTKYTGRLCVLNPDKYVGFDRYSVKMSYKIVSEKLSTLHRRGTLQIFLPKPTDEQLGYFNYTQDYAAKALAKYIAWQITSDNANSSRWITFASMLVKDQDIFKHSMDYIKKDVYKANQRKRCEAFLLFWSSHYIEREENKLEKMTDIFGIDSKKKAEAKQFIRPYCLSGTLTNENLKKMAFCLVDDWKLMAEKLGLAETFINHIKSTQKTPVRQSLKMLDSWRLSDAAITKGTDLVKHLYECARSAKCSSKLLKMITSHE